MNPVVKALLLTLATVFLAAVFAAVVVAATLAMVPGCSTARHARSCDECKLLDKEAAISAANGQINLVIQGNRPQQKPAGPPKPAKPKKAPK